MPFCSAKGSTSTLSKVAYDNDGKREERKMIQGKWTCSKCGAEITELPFEPDPERMDQLLCRDCHREKRAQFRR